MPGRRSTMRYCPVSSVTTERTFSIRTGLDASTVTPGKTAPEASLTTPVIAACAWAVDGKSNETITTRRAPEDRWIWFSIAVLPYLLRKWTTPARGTAWTDYF